MGRPLTLGAKFLTGQDDANPEEVFPKSIRHNPGCERIVFVHQPLRHREAIRAHSLGECPKDFRHSG